MRNLIGLSQVDKPVKITGARLFRQAFKMYSICLHPCEICTEHENEVLTTQIQYERIGKRHKRNGIGNGYQTVL